MVLIVHTLLARVVVLMPQLLHTDFLLDLCLLDVVFDGCPYYILHLYVQVLVSYRKIDTLFETLNLIRSPCYLCV